MMRIETMADSVAQMKPDLPTETIAKNVRPRRGRWLRRFFFLLLMVGTIGWFAPAIVATTELRNHVPRLLFPTFPGMIEFEEASLAWTSPVVIKNLSAKDENGQPVLEVGQFSTSESLFTLATRAGNFGTFSIVDPVVHVACRDDGTNLEDVLQKFLSGPPSGKPVADVIVEIHNGRVELEHATAGRKATIDQIALRLISTGGGVDELDLAIGNPPATADARTENSVHSAEGPSAASTMPADSSDWLAVRYGNRLDPNSAPSTANAKSIKVRASHWTLDRLAPALPRICRNAELQGTVNGDATLVLAVNDKTFDFDWNGTLAVEKLVVAGIEALRRDRLALDRVELSGRAATSAGRLSMHDLMLKTDVGQVTATGNMPLSSQSTKSSLELVQSLLSDEDYHIDSQVDLQKLAGLLPQTLHVREGIEITSGNVKAQLVGGNVGGVRRWSADAGIVGLTALQRGQKVNWDKPVSARVNAHRDQQAIVIDLAECKSDFLQLAGKGTLEDARFTASGDLSKLLQNLERFVDLGIQQLSGQIRMTGELKRKDNQHVALTSKVLLDDFAYVVNKNNVWREKHLELSVVAAGQTDARPMLTKIATGEAHLISGSDGLDLVLQQPIDLMSNASAYAATLNLKGNLTSWENRLRPIFAVDQWRLAGGINLATTVSADLHKVNVSKLSLGLKQLEAAGPQWLIRDPDLKLETAGCWDVAARQWTSPKTSLTGQALAMDLTGVECVLNNQGLAKLVGSATYRADLTQLSAWKNQAIPHPSCYLIGTLSGSANVTQQDRQLIAKLDTKVEKMVVAGPGTGANGQMQWVALWKERELRLTGKGAYDTTADRLALDTAHLDVDGLSLSAAGRLDNCSTSQRIDVTGDLAYDWDVLTKRLGPQLGQNLQVVGKDHRPFSLKGSLASLSTGNPTSPGIPAAPVSFQPQANAGQAMNPGTGSDLNGQAGFGWAMANIYGIKTGPADVSLTVQQGVCKMAPLSMTVNDGKLHVTPTVYLDRHPAMLVLGQERLLDQISLTPELCANALKYAVPMLADSTHVEGKISVQTNSASLPLSAPMTGVADGILIVHHAQAAPTGMAQQIVGAIDQIQAIITRKSPGSNVQVMLQMPQQQVPVHLQQGRVTHQGMKFLVNNISVTTSGSVGMDSSLNLVVGVGVRDEWIGNNKALAGLKGKTIQIGVVGTTSRPQIDPSVFSNLAQQMGGSAIEGLIQDKIGNGLNGVLKNNNGNGVNGTINNELDKLFKGKR